LPKRTKKHPYGTRHNEPTSFSLRSELYRVFGVDLTNVPGISAVTAQTILCEVGTDLSRFRNASAFASWLVLLCYKGNGIERLIADACNVSGMGVVRARIQTVEDMYRIVRTAVAGKQPIEARYEGALGYFVRTDWDGIGQANCVCCAINTVGKARADCNRQVRRPTGAALHWRNSVR